MKLKELRLLLADVLKDSEFYAKTYFAGGCVRDFLINADAPVRDADLAVALPHGGIELARYLHAKIGTSEPIIHRSFGTATSNWQGIQLDFALTRSETYTPGSRHPRVSFATLEQDSARRDFMVNALYQKVSGGNILDPTGKGLADLQNRLIRTVADPDSSFQEDPLRILRALRFTALPDFTIEPATLASLLRHFELIQKLSARKRQEELRRLRETLGEESTRRLRDLIGDAIMDRLLSNSLA
jgi:poly(A) polymerase